MRTFRITGFVAVSALIACGSPPSAGFDANVVTIDAGATPDGGNTQFDAAVCTTPPCEETVADISLARRDVDILFVVDNSGSMAEEQASLATNFGRFVNVLSNIEGGLPNVHIGVVSTDLGAGPFNISGCSGYGDNGALQNNPRSNCTPPTGAFISDIVGPKGSRDRNYSGSLAETFACIAQLGIDGCGFEQTLEAMRRALNGTNPGNAGFLRADALLAVVIVSDEDDCSVADTGMFDTSQTTIGDPLGPLASFRCFEFGVVCDPDTPRVAGVRASCTDRRDSRYMPPVQEYVDFLKGLKDDPLDVVVAGIIGNPSPVQVGTNKSNNPDLQPSCSSASGTADPAVRLSAFLAAFPARNTQSTICSADLSDALVLTAEVLRTRLGSKCLNDNAGNLHDLDPAAPGLQFSCTVTQIAADATEVAIPACDNTANPANSTNKPCYGLVVDPTRCGSTASQLALTVYRTGPVPTTGSVQVRCLVD